MSMRFLSSNDIDRIKKSISKPGTDCNAGFNVISRKERLKQLSAKRVSGWSDTLESTREAKLKWKRELQEREEEKRKEIDEEEEKIRARSNANIIKRAKDLQYEENEKVKILRSQQLYTDVVETRKQQMEERQEREKTIVEEERKWHEQSIKLIREQEKRDKEKSMLRKQRAIENAEEMKNQRIEIANENKKMLEVQRRAEEEYIRKTQMENEQSEEQMRQIKIQSRKKCKEEMQMILADNINKNKEMEMKEMEDEKKRQDDIARMTFLATARSQLEAKHFEERQKIRKLLSDRAAEELKLRSNREVEIFIKEQKALESKERARQEEEARLKKEREKEIHDSRQEQMKLKRLRKQTEADDEYLIVQKYQQMTLDELAREKRKEYEFRERHNQMRQFQLQQIEEKQQLRINEKESHLLEAKQITEELIKEDDLFKEFAMKEMERFKEAGKKTNLLKKALIG